MLWQIVGDPTGQTLKFLLSVVMIWRCQWDVHFRVPRRRAAIRAQIPDKRLGIDGSFLGDRTWKPAKRTLSQAA